MEFVLADGQARLTLVSGASPGESGIGTVRLIAHTAWLRAELDVWAIASEWTTLAKELTALHQSMAGAYRFDSIEGQLTMEFAMGKRGDVHVSVRLQDGPDYLHEARLVFTLDQSYLPLLAQAARDLAPGGASE